MKQKCTKYDLPRYLVIAIPAHQAVVGTVSADGSHLTGLQFLKLSGNSVTDSR